jgi:hypothetical protein
VAVLVGKGVDVGVGLGVLVDNGVPDGKGELLGEGVFPISTIPMAATIIIREIPAIKNRASLRFKFHPLRLLGLEARAISVCCNKGAATKRLIPLRSG